MNSNTTASFLRFTKKKSKTIVRTSIEVVLLACLLWILFIFVGRNLSKIALEQIAKLTNTKITTESLRFKADGSVVIEQLVVRPEQAVGYDNTILRAGTVQAHFNVGSVLLFRPRLKRIIISEFDFNIIYDSERGQWNLTGLKFATPKADSGKVPEIVLNQGTLLYSKITQKHKKTIGEIGFNLKLLPVPSINRGDSDPIQKTEENSGRNVYSFEIQTGQWSKFGKSELRGLWRPGRAELAGVIEPATRKWGKDVLSAGEVNAILNYKANKDYSLRLNIQELTSRKESVDEHFRILRSLFPARLGAFEALQKVFDRFRPGGQIDLNIKFSGNLSRLNESKLAGEVYCKDVWICDERFKYPIDKLTGRIDVTEQGAVLNNLKGHHKNVELCFNGWTQKSDGKQQYNFEITSDNMSLDEDLYKALSPQRQKVWDDFSLEGTISIKQNINKISEEKSSVLAIDLLNSRARWRHFPYPLKNLSGELVLDSNKITFKDVVSRSDEEKITINGKVSSYNSSNPLYDIEIEAEKINPAFIRTEEYTRHIGVLLPKYIAKTINELQVTGNVNLKAHLENREAEDGPDYDIAIDFPGNGIDYAPIAYPLRDVRGRMKIKNEGIKLEKIKGTAADNIQITKASSNIKIDGEITTAGDSFSEATLRIEAEDISLDERLGVALPKEVKNIYFNMSPTGRCDLDLREVRIFTASDGAKYINLSGLIEFKGCNFSKTAAITELNAALQIEGLYKSGYGFSEGRAELKDCSVRIKDKLLTELKADMVYNNKLRQWQSTMLTGSCYEGTVAGRFELKGPEQGRTSYVLDVGFYDIDLRGFLSDPYHYQRQGEASVAKRTNNNRQNSYSQGNLDGSLGIKGLIGGENERIGRCRLTITDMRVGKLSPIAKLLYILKLTEPKDFAFEQMIVDSYVRNNNLFLKKVDISGKAIAFNGSGYLDLQELNIDLILTARGQRLASARPGVLQSLTESLGQGIVRMDITGNIYEPKVITETLPVIKGALHLLGTK